ncbi:MAG: prolipoprotein diacylglyceryl transferase [Bacteroidales bacterium]|nr:prolipoprotein diacylglyceryl transferase [Bacteroidales bacterium]
MLSNAIIWDFEPVLFGVLRWYSLLFALAFVAGYIVLQKIIFKKENISNAYLDKLSVYVFLGVLIGARLGHCLFYEPSYYLSHITEMLLPIAKTADGWKFVGYQGLASHGGAIGILIAIWLYARKTKLTMLWTLDRLVIVVALAGLFIRLGNLCNSEIYGIATNSDWGFIFVRNGETVAKHPTQLYEAIAYFITFAILLFIYLKQKTKVIPGTLFSLFLILAFTSRLIIENWKEVQEAWEASMALNMGQILSLPFIAIGIVILILALMGKTGKPLDTSKIVETHKNK